MPSECVLPCEASAAGAPVRLIAAVDLGVSLEVVLTDEALSASVALELSIAKMRLDMGTYVFSSSKDLCASWVKTGPLACRWILLANVSLDFLGRDASEF
jgi:hypothetical protein